MFELTLLHDNAAFDDDRVQETTRALRELADRLEREVGHDTEGTYWGGVRDINGIACGCWSFSPPQRERTDMSPLRQAIALIEVARDLIETEAQMHPAPYRDYLQDAADDLGPVLITLHGDLTP
jgi:hypothetical protein